MLSTFNKSKKIPDEQKKKIKPKPCFSTEKLSFCPSSTPRYLIMEEFVLKNPKTKDTVIALIYKLGSKVVVIKTLKTFTFSTA